MNRTMMMAVVMVMFLVARVGRDMPGIHIYLVTS